MLVIELEISNDKLKLIESGDESIIDYMAFGDVILRNSLDGSIIGVNGAYPGNYILNLMESAIYLMNGYSTECHMMGGSTFYQYYIAADKIVIKKRQEQYVQIAECIKIVSKPLEFEFIAESDALFKEIYRFTNELVSKLLELNTDIFNQEGSFIQLFYHVYRYFIYVYETTYLTTAYDRNKTSSTGFIDIATFNAVPHNGGSRRKL